MTPGLPEHKVQSFGGLAPIWPKAGNSSSGFRQMGDALTELLLVSIEKLRADQCHCDECN